MGRCICYTSGKVLLERRVVFEYRFGRARRFDIQCMERCLTLWDKDVSPSSGTF